MKKRILIGIFLAFVLIIISCNLHKEIIKIDDNNVLGVYLDNELQSSIPKKGEAVFSKAICDNDGVNYYWDVDNWGLYIDNLNKKTKCNLYFVNYSGETTFDFDYTGGEQTFTVPVSGTYRLETWGSQGGSGVNKNTNSGLNEYIIRNGGYGGYSSGYVNLTSEGKLYVNVGGGGSVILDNTENINQVIPGGYNGGGSGLEYVNGGGATHIATKSGTLNLLENYIEKILLVSGGGGGASAHAEGGGYCYGGAGGGYKGSNGIVGSTGYEGDGGVGATQLTGYLFGLGISGGDITVKDGSSGGGGGFYGGLTGTGNNSWNACGGGGSGYIGNSLLKNKKMYCYNCEESNEESTKTISTTCAEKTPTENCAKKGNGYARITLVSIDE